MIILYFKGFINLKIRIYSIFRLYFIFFYVIMKQGDEMFCNYNTDCIHITNVFTTTVNRTEVGTGIRRLGETKFYQLGIKIKGETSITYNNNHFIYDDNSVLFLPCETQSDIPYNKIFLKPGSGVCIFFTSEHSLSNSAKLYKLNDHAIATAFKRILNEFKGENKLKAKSTFYEILSLLDETEKPYIKSEFSNILTYINNNIDKPYIDLNEAAKQFGYSTDYFRHKFSKEVGIAPKRYIISLKIKLAEDLLLNSNLCIRQIAGRVGFYDTNYFTRFFKKETGYTPTDFRKNIKV